MVMRLKRLVDRVAEHLGGPRPPALPLIRWRAVLAVFTWNLLSPPAPPGWDAVDTIILAFFLYSVAVAVALWMWPGRALSWNLPVLLIHQPFPLLLLFYTFRP